MTILRLRAEVADERGRLSSLASAIAACRGNILGIDVHFLDGARVADEFTIDFPEGHSGMALATALRRAGGVNVAVEELDEHAIVDSVARAIDVAASVVGPEPGDGRLAAAAAQLVHADRAAVVDETMVRMSPLLRGTALPDAHTVCRGHALTSGGASPGELPWVLIVPDVVPGRRRWMVVQRAAPRFSSSEAARVAALLRLAASGTSTGGPATRRTGGGIRRRPASFFPRRVPAESAPV